MAPQKARDTIAPVVGLAAQLVALGTAMALGWTNLLWASLSLHSGDVSELPTEVVAFSRPCPQQMWCDVWWGEHRGVSAREVSITEASVETR
eukprot:CAMPEP_0113950938 /NCGR_PEP_ID=MMETSP1339-20121228/83285_1 /TAXON_ID=94617 /ORGANISM="Fibrocapsa japonica" /LENGTH=91 /DNA_ID=CAMNT_0000958963 /DNA_START=232 /DNA_END=507 /DNA_ORIENTATION=- /assembly_acc=CAM_ASM_000762